METPDDHWVWLGYIVDPDHITNPEYWRSPTSVDDSTYGFKVQTGLCYDKA